MNIVKITRLGAMAIVVVAAGCSGSDTPSGGSVVTIEPNYGVDDASIDAPAGDIIPPSDASPEPASDFNPGSVTSDEPLPRAVATQLQSVFEIINGDAIEASIAIARELVDVEVGPREGFRFSRSGVDDETGVEDTTLLCEGGGTLDTTSARLLSSAGIFVLRECAVGRLSLNGQIEGRVRGPNRPNNGEQVLEPSYQFLSFSVVDDRDGQSIQMINAGVRPSQSGANAPNADVAERLGFGTINALAVASDTESLVVRHADREYRVVGSLLTQTQAPGGEANPLGGMTTSFSVRFAEQGPVFEVRTPVPFVDLDDAGRFTTGTLIIGNETVVYRLAANNGDAETFLFEISEGGMTTSYTVLWSDAFGFDPLAPEGIDPGF